MMFQQMKVLEFTISKYYPYQHSCSEVKVLKELCDEDVSLQHILSVTLFHLLEDVNEPFKVFLVRCHPEEIHLQAKNTHIFNLLGLANTVSLQNCPV